MEVLKRSLGSELFAEKLVTDERDPVQYFSVPGIDGTWELFAPSWEHWRQLILLAVICQFIQVIFSIFIYQFIILKRRTMSSYLIGWTLLIPLSLSIPYLMIEFYDLKNLSIKTIPSMLPISVVFRIVEAMYNTSPPCVEDNLQHYMIYYTAGSQHVWDLKTKTYATPTLHHMLTCIPKLVHYYLAVCISLSFLFYTDFSPFPQSPVEQQNFHFNLDVFNPYHIANGYCFGVHTYFHLRLFFNILTFGENVKGFTTREPFRDPLWSSTSPTDFWNRRWNTVVHDILKGGAFLPAKQYFSSGTSLLIAFAMSGLMHEYTWSVTFYHQSASREEETGVCSDCYSHKMLKLTLFFVWNGIIMFLERPCRKLPVFKWISKNLPVPIISTLVLATALPIFHWFVGDWVEGGFFADWAPAFALIKKVG